MVPLEMVVAFVLPALLFVFSLGIAIYVTVLLSRLVRAVEKIAATLDCKK